MEAARTATEGDLPRISALAQQAAGGLAEQRGGPIWLLREGRPELGEPAFAASLGRGDHRLVVGTIDDVVVGFVAARAEDLRDGTRHAVVDEVYVQPEARGVGVGEAMMDDVVAWSEAQGCVGIDAVALPGDRGTKNFFERFGLTARAIIVHRRLDPDGAGGAGEDGS